MSAKSQSTRLMPNERLLSTGLYIGLAGGLAEIAVIWLYETLTGGNPADVARGVASAVRLDGASAIVGVTVHMVLAVALGIGLAAVLRPVGRRAPIGAVFPFMLCGLAIIWGINFFIVLPVVSPSFVQLLPYAVTLASKLAFGLASGVTFRALPLRPATRQPHQTSFKARWYDRLRFDFTESRAASSTMRKAQ
jgi:hypothetical protein